ncbi:hypothetical protein FBEOM_1000 [Fusarium beomiforme]|uniref:Uncharacterized protein n=1 Tax=Fusarium beomiforme TaxID=44412 RepID=A0A9P5AUR2_9HYPO|nr:hypothetical protein FBEOM_1000 [Fusarium beomiforme]
MSDPSALLQTVRQAKTRSELIAILASAGSTSQLGEPNDRSRPALSPSKPRTIPRRCSETRLPSYPAMPETQKTAVPAKGRHASKSDTKSEVPVPYKFTGRDAIDLTSFDLANVQERLQHSDVPSSSAMQPQLKSPRKYPLEFNHPIHWHLRQHEYLVSRTLDQRQSVLPLPEQTSEAFETLPPDEPTNESPGELSIISGTLSLPAIYVSPPKEAPEDARQPHPFIKIENPTDPREEEELRALEEARREQRRVHGDTLFLMSEVCRWSIKAHNSALRLRKTMAELRRYMDEVRSEEGEAQGPDRIDYGHTIPYVTSESQATPSKDG